MDAVVVLMVGTRHLRRHIRSFVVGGDGHHLITVQLVLMVRSFAHRRHVLTGSVAMTTVVAIIAVGYWLACRTATRMGGVGLLHRFGGGQVRPYSRSFRAGATRTWWWGSDDPVRSVAVRPCQGRVFLQRRPRSMLAAL